MITTDQALEIILQNSLSLSSCKIPLPYATGRVLQEALHADRDFPPFDRVTMDGIAINYEAFAQGQTSFPVEGVCAAGSPAGELKNPKNCLEVMTGAPRPQGTDTVIRYEDVVIEKVSDKENVSGSLVSLTVEGIRQGQNVHGKGTDLQSGDLIATASRRITAAEIGVAATIGKAEVEVSALPMACVISTGDELVPVGETPLPHQIRRSNVHSILAILKENGLPANNYHITDEKHAIKEKIAELLKIHSVLLLSGGVSKGKYDYLPEVFEELGVTKLFHKVQQRPGKPFWFGKAPNGSIIFAFPGNPVSTFMCTKYYFLPWLRKSLGLPQDRPKYAALSEEVTFKPDLTLFMAVELFFDATGRQWAKPVRGNGSGDLASLVHANGIMVLPQGKVLFERGESFVVIW